MEQSRKAFLQKAALGLAGTAAFSFTNTATPAAGDAPPGNTLLPVGIAGYTFAKFDVGKSIAMMKRLNIHSLSLKDFHLPLDSDDATIKSVLSQFAAADIKIYTVGVIYMKTQDAVDKAFDYARRVGVDMIVGVPNYELLDYTEQKVKSTGIKIAIHNHGPEDQLYPGPQNVLDRIRGRDARLGLCMDIGHARRAGADLEKSIKEAGHRLFDLHIKDVNAIGREGKAIEIGHGIIDFPAVVKALYAIGYNGMCSIEYEKDMTDPLPGIAESIGFFKGVVAAVA